MAGLLRRRSLPIAGRNAGSGAKIRGAVPGRLAPGERVAKPTHVHPGGAVRSHGKCEVFHVVLSFCPLPRPRNNDHPLSPTCLPWDQCRPGGRPRGPLTADGDAAGQRRVSVRGVVHRRQQDPHRERAAVRQEAGESHVERHHGDGGQVRRDQRRPHHHPDGQEREYLLVGRFHRGRRQRRQGRHRQGLRQRRYAVYQRHRQPQEHGRLLRPRQRWSQRLRVALACRQRRWLEQQRRRHHLGRR